MGRRVPSVRWWGGFPLSGGEGARPVAADDAHEMTLTFWTAICPVVRVPVLSLQMTLVHPSVSTDGKCRTCRAHQMRPGETGRGTSGSTDGTCRTCGGLSTPHHTGRVTGGETRDETKRDQERP